MDLSHIDLVDVDEFTRATPHHWFRELREHDPVHWQEEANGPGFWSVTKYADLRHVSRNPLIFSSERGGTQIRDLTEQERAEAGEIPIMLEMDPPRHVKFRRIVQRGFTPRRVREQEGHIREIARRIVDAAAPRGEAEFVAEVAADLPLQVICEMMGVPLEDRSQLFANGNKMIGFDDPELGGENRQESRAAMAQIFGYALKLAERYRDRPADNLTSRLLHGEVDGEKLSELEYCAFFLLLCIAGNETTRTVTTNGMRLLIEHPDQLQLLVEDPSLVPSAVEEILRYEPAVHCFRRTALRDTELRGRQIREGDKVVLWYPSVNRDEEVFDEPDAFDVRRHPNEHLSFGIGEHYCLGANLARLELNVIFGEIVARLRDPKLAAPPRRLRSNFVNGVKEMRITFTPERA
jgi:cholest-4-en-3-one 26-monooxygenase